MSLITVRRDELYRLRPGDAIISIDDHDLPRPAVVEDYQDRLGVRLVSDSPAGVEHYLYPDNVFESLLVERQGTWKTDLPVLLEKLPTGSYLNESGRYVISPQGAGWKIWDETAQEYLKPKRGNAWRTLRDAAYMVAQQEDW